MSKPGPCEDLMDTNAHLREQVAALSQCLREVLGAPLDSFALANACYVLAKIDKSSREYTHKAVDFQGV